MIFDCNYVTELVKRWLVTNDDKLLETILTQSSGLIEAIVSGYDSHYREDLIQEANLRVQYALPFFDESKANLHTYLTTVIKNICLTYLRKQVRYDTNEYQVELLDTISNFGGHDQLPQSYNVLEDLITRNRNRFPSIPAIIIDDITEILYDGIADNLSKRAIIQEISKELGHDNILANTFYTSSLLYLRLKYIHNAEKLEVDELSINKDLEELFGRELGATISIIFSGMTIHFP